MLCRPCRRKEGRLMSYKDLLIVLDTDASVRERIEIAAALAERFAAHLVGLYSLPMPEAPRHFGYFDPALLNPVFEELRAKARDAADKMRNVFERIVSLRGVSADWREIPEGADADPAPCPLRRSHHSRSARS